MSIWYSSDVSKIAMFGASDPVARQLVRATILQECKSHEL
jgi:hypothetical protein